jgi:hypothetical protein
VLAKLHAQDWIQVQIQLQETVRFRQNHRRHPTPRTLFRRAVKQIPKVQAQRNLAGIARAQAMDGIFPLTTNTLLTPLQVLRAYQFPSCRKVAPPNIPRPVKSWKPLPTAPSTSFTETPPS